MTNKAIYVSPTEPLSLRSHFTTSSMPEKFGVDLIWSTPKGFVGIQRKTPQDLIASLHDGRISKQTAQAQEQGLFVQAIFLEGHPTFTLSGELLSSHVHFTKNQWEGVLFSLMNDGWWVVHCRDRSDLIERTERLYVWSEKTRHNSTKARRGPKSDSWKRISNKSWCIHILTSIPGIGPGTAENIYDTFGRVPLAWNVSMSELQTVKGIGPKGIKEMTKYVEVLFDE